MLIEYSFLKVIHIGALVLWLGPALGAWLILKATESVSNVSDEAHSRIHRMFFHMITLEHVAFCTLLITGVTMAIRFDYWDAPWLQNKLWMIAVIIIPLEIVDIWLGNWKAARISKKLYSGVNISVEESRILSIYHGLFTKVAIVLIPISVLLIMWLAVSKTPFF